MNDSRVGFEGGVHFLVGRFSLVLLLTLLSFATAHAGDLETGDIVIGDCPNFQTTHVDVDTGEQYPIAIGFADQVAHLSNGDLAVLQQLSNTLFILRITPSTGAIRIIAEMADTDFAAPSI